MDTASKILFKEESYKIIGACMKVHRTLGSGFLEAVYEEAMEKEFKQEKIHFRRQIKLELVLWEKEIEQILQSRFYLLR